MLFADFSCRLPTDCDELATRVGRLAAAVYLSRQAVPSAGFMPSDQKDHLFLLLEKGKNLSNVRNSLFLGDPGADPVSRQHTVVA